MTEVDETVAGASSAPEHENRVATQQGMDAVLAALAEGMLTLPPPFDYRASVALWANDSTGVLALRLFEAAQTALGQRQFHVTITEVHDSMPNGRVVIDAIGYGTDGVAALFVTFIQDLVAGPEQEEEGQEWHVKSE